MFLPFIIALLLGWVSPSTNGHNSKCEGGTVQVADAPDPSDPGDGGTTGPGSSGDNGQLPPPKP